MSSDLVLPADVWFEITRQVAMTAACEIGAAKFTNKENKYEMYYGIYNAYACAADLIINFAGVCRVARFAIKRYIREFAEAEIIFDDNIKHQWRALNYDISDEDNEFDELYFILNLKCLFDIKNSVIKKWSFSKIIVDFIKVFQFCIYRQGVSIYDKYYEEGESDKKYTRIFIFDLNHNDISVNNYVNNTNPSLDIIYNEKVNEEDEICRGSNLLFYRYRGNFPSKKYHKAFYSFLKLFLENNSPSMILFRPWCNEIFNTIIKN